MRGPRGSALSRRPYFAGGVKPVTAGREAVISMVAPEKEAAVEAAPEAAAAATPAAAGKDAKAAPAGKAAAPAKPAAKK